MKRLWMVILLAVYLAVGCGAHMPEKFTYINSPNGYSPIPLKVIPIYVDKNFGEADKVAIDDAVMQWNYALNGYIKLQVVSWKFDLEPDVIRTCLSGHCWMLLKTDSKNPMVQSLDAPQKGTWTLAWANEIGGNRIFMIRDRISNQSMTGVMLHEMGHLLGAHHDNVYLMKPIFNWEEARCVDYAALKLVAEYQHLPFANLNYCIYGSLGLGQEKIK